jgi:hypothetical protein
LLGLPADSATLLPIALGGNRQDGFRDGTFNYKKSAWKRKNARTRSSDLVKAKSSGIAARHFPITS